MGKTLTKILFYSFLAFASFTSLAGTSSEGGDEFKPKDMILHHIADAYEWHFFDYKNPDGSEHHVSMPLPVILLTDGNLDVFMSSEFHHGEQQVIKGDRVYRMEHNHITEANGKKVMDFSITKNVFSMFVSCVILLSVFIGVGNAYKRKPGQVPSGLQAFVEPIVLYLRDDVIIPNVGEAKYKKYMPYLLTVFFFIWINNLLGLVPSGANASGNIAFTLTLAVFSGLITVLSGNANYWKHIFATPGVPFYMLPIMIPVEIIGIFTKPFALMIRLFANITAGHIVILCLVSFIFIFKQWAMGLPVGFFVVAITFLELFVAALQAYIFTLLSSLFIGLAIEEHHDDHH